MKYEKNMAFKQYVLREFLGKGAYSEAWKAFDTEKERETTLKIGLDESVRESFEKEYRITKGLPEGVAPRALEVHIDFDPPFLVREWLPSRPLREVMEKESPLALQRAYSIANTLLLTLERLHDAGVTHGDLKPENILLQEDGEELKIQLLDFAGAQSEMEREDLLLSQDLSDGEKKSHHATFLYMAPELREKGAKPDGKCDIYSAGLIFFELFTGRLPQGMELPSEAREELNERIDEVFREAVAPRERRYANFRAMIGDLNNKAAPRVKSRPGLWSVLTGKYPSPFGLRIFLWFITFASFAGAIVQFNPSAPYDDRVIFQWILGLFALLWFSLFLCRFFAIVEKKIFSNLTAFLLFFLWGAGIGILSDRASSANERQIENLWIRYEKALKKDSSFEDLKKLCDPSTAEGLVTLHKTILQSRGPFERKSHFRRGWNEKERKNRQYLATFHFKRGAVQAEFYLVNKAPEKLGGIWVFKNIQFFSSPLTPKLPKTGKTARWSDFERRGSQTIIFRGRTHTINIWRHKETRMTFSQIPTGYFFMGGADPPSKPVHRVDLSESFLISQFEVPQGLFEQVMKTKPWEGQKYAPVGNSYPAVYINWNEAKEFCQKLGWRLPTEGEWEYACRAESPKNYYWGDAFDPKYGWSDENTPDSRPQEIGKKIPNKFGLFDMSGNVWEWCEDDWTFDYSGAPSDGKAGQGGGNKKVVRGGSWNSGKKDLSSWFRAERFADHRDSEVGFRCVVVPR